jgi:hypothetical protein
MGLNQGQMVMMIENAHTGQVWKAFMTNPEIASMRRVTASLTMHN